jgi:hypothetical protein
MLTRWLSRNSHNKLPSHAGHIVRIEAFVLRHRHVPELANPDVREVLLVREKYSTERLVLSFHSEEVNHLIPKQVTTGNLFQVWLKQVSLFHQLVYVKFLKKQMFVFVF